MCRFALSITTIKFANIVDKNQPFRLNFNIIIRYNQVFLRINTPSNIKNLDIMNQVSTFLHLFSGFLLYISIHERKRINNYWRDNRPGAAF